MKQKFLVQAVFTALAIATLPSCAIFKYKCNREYAAKKGMDDAVNGRTAMPGRLEGNTCDGDYSASDYSKDYNFGFQQKKQEICAPATAASWGRADGESGNAAKPQKGKLGMCEDNRLYGVYDNEFKKAFCAPARAQKLGAERAASWQPADYETAFHDCGGGKTLRNAYMGAYRDTVANNCTLDNAKKSGEAEANAHRAPDGVRGHLQTCPTGTQELLAAFDNSYNTTKAALDKAAADAAAAAAAAARQAQVNQFLTNTATSYFPYNLRNYIARCSVSPDKTYITVEIENDYPEQVIVYGYWKILYYGNDFTKITEDRDQESTLVTGNNRKSFQKMTLPKDAVFCRAEFLGGGQRPY